MPGRELSPNSSVYQTIALPDGGASAPFHSCVKANQHSTGANNDFLHHRRRRRDCCGRELSRTAFLKGFSARGAGPYVQTSRRSPLAQRRKWRPSRSAFAQIQVLSFQESSCCFTLPPVQPIRPQAIEHLANMDSEGSRDRYRRAAARRSTSLRLRERSSRFSRMFYLQAKIMEMPSRFAISLAEWTAVRKERSLMVFDWLRATVIVRPRGCLAWLYSPPYSTST
jgi:hypothetical protein